MPAPAHLVAEIRVPSPETAWQKVRTAAGGPTLFFPRSLGGLLANALALPIVVAGSVDERLPVVGAVGVEGNTADVVLGVHVRHGPSMVHTLTYGPDARFDARVVAELTHLMRRGGETAPRIDGVVVGVMDHYLLIGNDAAALDRLGPYVARTLSRRPAPAAGAGPDVEVEAVGGAVSPLLVRALDALVARTEAMTSSDLAVALAPLRELVDLSALGQHLRPVAEGARGARLTLALGPQWVVEASLDVAPGSPGVALVERPTVAPAALKALPADSFAVAAFADATAARDAEAASRATRLVALLGDEAAHETLAPKLTEALRALGRGRAAEAMVGARCGGAGLTGYLSTEVTDGEAVAGALVDLVEVVRSPSVGKRLAAQSLRLSVNKDRLRHVDFDVTRLRLEHKAPRDDHEAQGDSPPPTDLLFGLDGSRLLAAAGRSPTDTLQELVKQTEQLGARVPVADALASLPATAWAVLMVDVAELAACASGQPGDKPASPVVLAVGPRGDTGAWLHLRVPTEAVKQAVRGR